jgi:LysR family transcriptional regulator, hydrogen peroxide-inducible genes activator
MTITLRQLRYLVALGREGHFARAAASCYISQPALSMQIKELEAILGAPLVERSRGRIALTAIGHETVRRAQAILMDVDDLVAAARHAAGALAGRLRLGVIPTVAPYLLPRALPLIRQRFPAVQIELREGQTETILRELAEGALDVLLLSLPISDPELATQALFDDRFFLVAPAGDPLAARRRADLDSIPHQRLLLLEEGHCLRDQALSVCRLAGDATLPPLGATSLATIVQMVAAGYGITLVPEMAVPVEIRDGSLTIIPFSAPEPRRTIGLAWRRANPRRMDFSALADALAELAPKPPDRR